MDPQPLLSGVLSGTERPAHFRPPPAAGMKIALVCDWYLPRIGGIERQLVQLAGHLAAAGHAVAVITPWKGPPMDSPGVRVQRIPARLLPGAGLLWTPASYRRLGAAIRAGGFDVVHAHTSIISPAAFAALYQAQKAGLPTVSTTHSIIGGYTGAFRALDRLARWSRWPVVYSAVSDRVARELQPIVDPRPVDVLPNAVDPAEWRALQPPPPGRLAIACVMRLVRRKRGTALLRALREACARLPVEEWPVLHIAGDGPERRRLEGTARDLGLAGAVRFHGAATPAEVKALLASSHFFVLPSRLEAFGIAALEARAAGLPVIALRESGVGEFIEDGVDGLLADGDGQLAAHLLRLCRDAGLRRRIAEHNRAVPVTCTWERAVADHLATYERARWLAAESSEPAFAPMRSSGVLEPAPVRAERR